MELQSQNTPVERRAGVALWRQIAQTLEREIQDGTYPMGSQLPTEAQLSRRFSVNRHTLRRAVAFLQEAGLIRVEQGRGTFVQEDTIDYSIGRRTRFSENVRRLGRTPAGKLVSAETVPAESPVAQALGMPRGAPVVQIELLHLVDGRPVTITSHFFPARRFDGLIAAYQRTSSITEALRGCGIPDYFRRSTKVSARLPNMRDAQHLQMPRTQPVVVTESVNVDDSGRVIEYAVGRCAGQRMQIVFEP